MDDNLEMVEIKFSIHKHMVTRFNIQLKSEGVYACIVGNTISFKEAHAATPQEAYDAAFAALEEERLRYLEYSKRERKPIDWEAIRRHQRGEPKAVAQETQDLLDLLNLS
jgi:hypothetical protein